MKIILTTNARLYKTPDGKYWSTMVYGYDFFTRYLKVFDNITLIAHTKAITYSQAKKKIRVDGKGLEIHDVYFPRNKIDYIKNYNRIKRDIIAGLDDCDGVILRIPDQLAFQVYKQLEKNTPIAAEITSNSKEFFSFRNYRSVFRPFLKFFWHRNQKKISADAYATSYVTKKGLQQIYPPKKAFEGDGFTTNITSANLDDSYYYKVRDFRSNNKFNLIHVSGNIGNDSKGYRELIKSIALLRKKGIKVKLTLIGGGNLSSESKRLVEKNNVSVEHKGLLESKTDLQNELKVADVFVFPSYTEGLPRVVLEAMASGLPCVATNLSGIKELINEEYLVTPKDYRELTDALYKLLTNKDELIMESSNNFKKAQEYHSTITENKRLEFLNKLKDQIIIQKEKINTGGKDV